MGELEDLRRENRKLRIAMKGLKKRIPPDDWREEADRIVQSVVDLREELKPVLDKMPDDGDHFMAELTKLVDSMKATTDGFKKYSTVLDKVKEGSKKGLIKFCLVEITASPGMRHTSWYKDAGDHWVNESGGYCCKSKDDKIIRREEEKYFEDLSWEHLKDPDSKYGWLSPEGEFHGCTGTSTRAYADWLFERTSYELTEAGWLEVKRGVVRDAWKPTEAQKTTALERGFTLDGGDWAEEGL